MSVTPNMGLILPTPTVTPGPLYASQEVTAFESIDAHDHTAGKGVPVPVSGLNINADFPFGAFNAVGARSYRTEDQVAAIGLGTDLHCLYSVNGDMYWNNGLGQQIQITAGGGLNATSIGGIGGDYATSPASVFYTQLSALFTFWQNTNQAAKIECGPLTIHTLTVGGNGVTLSAPVGLSADYGITFPLANPLSTKLVGWDSTGNLIPAYDTDNSTLEINGTILRVKDLGITTAKIADQAILASKIVNNIVLNGNCGSTGDFDVGGDIYAGPAKSILVDNGSISLSKQTFGLYTGLSSSGGPNGVFFPNAAAGAALTGNIGTKALGVGDPATGASLAIVTGSGGTPLRVIRGAVNGATGAVGAGEDFTSSRSSAGNYQVNFNTAFSVAPMIVMTASGPTSGGFTTLVAAVSTTAATLQTQLYFGGSPIPADSSFHFIAIGPR